MRIFVVKKIDNILYFRTHIKTAVKNSIFRAVLLIGIYSLHLLFIETLMAKPYVNSIQHFKTFFSNHQTKHYPHPPVTDYYQIHKHESKVSRTEIALPFAAIEHGTFVSENPEIIISPPINTSRFYCCLNDDLFKRYRLHSTFLI